MNMFKIHWIVIVFWKIIFFFALRTKFKIVTVKTMEISTSHSAAMRIAEDRKNGFAYYTILIV